MRITISGLHLNWGSTAASTWSAGEPSIKAFLVYYIRPQFFGKTFLRLIYWWESAFPRLAARLGMFPMFIIKKAGPSAPAGPVSISAWNRRNSDLRQ